VRSIRFWRPKTALVSDMLLLEHEDRLQTIYSERFWVIVVREGAFDGWYRGRVHTHVRGALKLKEPDEVHRDVEVHAPFTLQGAAFSAETVREAAAALGMRGPVHFLASGFDVDERATRLAFAMHAALVDPDATEIEQATRVTETLGAILGEGLRPHRAPRAVRLARAFLHDAMADKVTLDELAAHAGLDKFHLVRAFRAEVGLPPYEYLTHVRIARAKELLRHGTFVAEAAQAVGFCDESQLHRHFRRIVGIPPGSFARCYGQHRPSGGRAMSTYSSRERTQTH